MQGNSAVERQVAALLVDSQCALGEGLVWCGARHAWIWTDIDGSRIWFHRPSDGRTASWRAPDRVGSFVLCESGGLLLALTNGLAMADIDLSGSEGADALLGGARLDSVEAEISTTRINDGRTDRHGAFVFGTYNEPEDASIGSLYQYSTDRGLRRLDLGHVTTTNSICFSRGGETMYFCDSPQRRIMCCDYDSARAAVSNVRTFVEFRVDQGMPDGSVIDTDGGLWNAEWGAGVVRRYDERGQITHEVTVAATHPTCPAFGGAGLNDLAITSARKATPAAELARTPAAGGLFHTRVAGVRGIPESLFNG
ncbi:MAG: SMP-30/gluconolactonase/LRE family protein [Vicinamibacterales bacterium]